MRILFMGTPDLSRTVLEALCEAGHEIVLCVTQPDREKGRGKAVQCSPVKEAALLRGIPVFQPERLRREENVAGLREFLEEHPADVGVVAAFGQILPQSVLDLPRFGCINVHTSLLPKYRGASPIEAAILAGESETGVTTMQMDAGLDTGDILLQEICPIDPEDTGGSLTEKLAALGGKLIVETLKQLEAGSLSRRPQEGESSYAGLIRKEAGCLNFACPADELERRIRAFDPWPGTYTFRAGKRLKIGRAAVIREEDAVCPLPGTVLAASKRGIDVQTGGGILRILSLQPEGKKLMPADAYLRGYAVQPGEILGEIHE
ncbi:MAG: methionyl-tRNA formyltransferase [Lachnospiraceae bacterium]|nr:methionyl-tRNA formyltransferase [Lachnospiraceae bacterium]